MKEIFKNIKLKKNLNLQLGNLFTTCKCFLKKRNYDEMISQQKEISKGMEVECNKPLFFKNIKLNFCPYSVYNVNILKESFDKLNIYNEK